MFGAIIETTYNAFVRIHVRRVYEAVVTTPLSVADVVVGEYLWATTRAVIYGLRVPGRHGGLRPRALLVGAARAARVHRGAR